MRVTINEQSEIILREVYVGIGLQSDSGEQFSICMRDTGFEFYYGGRRYEAKNGKLEGLGCTKLCGMNYCDDNGCTERKRCLVPLEKVSFSELT